MSAIAAVKTSSILGTLETTTSATVGVDKTFDPEGFRLPGVARWVDRSGGIAIGYPAMTLQVRPPTKTSRIYRVTTRLSLPTLEITSPSTSTGIQPQPTLAYTLQANLEFLLPERSTLAERTAFLSHIRSILATTIQASDAVPSDLTGSPVPNAVLNYDAPF